MSMESEEIRFSAATKMISEIVTNITIFSSRSARNSGRLISFHVLTCTPGNCARELPLNLLGAILVAVHFDRGRLAAGAEEALGFAQVEVGVRRLLVAACAGRHAGDPVLAPDRHRTERREARARRDDGDGLADVERRARRRNRA